MEVSQLADVTPQGVDVNDSNARPVEISVIVPVYNEETRLDQNFRALLAQQETPPFEIVYVDDCSTDGSWKKLESFAAQDNRVRAHRLPKRVSRGAVGRMGVTLARGNIIAIVGADCVVESDWLSHVRLLVGSTVVVGFPVFPPPDIEYLHWKFNFKGSGQVPPGNMPHGAGSLIRKDVLLKAGNFPDSRVGADTKAFRAIQALGGGILLAQAPPVQLLQKRTSITDHLRRHFERGRNAGPQSRKTYAMMLGTLVALLTLTVFLWSALPLLSIAMLVAAFSPLVNPGRVRYYVRSFERPRNILARTVLFLAIKLLESVSILLGYLSSFRRRTQM